MSILIKGMSILGVAAAISIYAREDRSEGSIDTKPLRTLLPISYED
jgi:hypothetical protein